MSAPDSTEEIAAAARVLLRASDGQWPSVSAKMKAVGAYTMRNGKCRPTALTDAWIAALEAVAATAPASPTSEGGET